MARLQTLPLVAPSEYTANAMGASLLAGRLVATAISPADGLHITVRFAAKRPRNRAAGESRWQSCSLWDATRCFVDVPGNNLAPGDKLGTFDVVTSTFFPAAGADQRRVNAARYILLAAASRVDGHKVRQSTDCFYCGRELTDPESISRGLGPVCHGKATSSQHERRHIDDWLPQVRGADPAVTALPPAEPTQLVIQTPQEPGEPVFLQLAPGQDPRDVLRDR